MKRNAVGHRALEAGDLRADDIIVVDEQRSPAGFGDEILRGIAADHQLAGFGRREMGRDGPACFISRSPSLQPYSAAMASYSWAARYFSASRAAMQPVPAAVTAWR